MAHYDRDDRHSYEQLFSVMRRLNGDYPDFEQIFRRMVFNVLSRNHDDHTKNHSFIMNQDGSWKLAPAYDLCYTYSPSGQWTNKHQMSVNAKRDNFTIDDLLKIGNEQGINRPKSIIGEIRDAVANWESIAKRNQVPPAFIQQVQPNLHLHL